MSSGGMGCGLGRRDAVIPRSASDEGSSHPVFDDRERRSLASLGMTGYADRLTAPTAPRVNHAHHPGRETTPASPLTPAPPRPPARLAPPAFRLPFPHVPAPDRRQPAARHRPPHARWRRGGAEHGWAGHRPLPAPRAVGRALDRLVRGGGRSQPRAASAARGSALRPAPGRRCRSARTRSPATTRATPTGCSGPCSTTCSTRSRSRPATGTPTWRPTSGSPRWWRRSTGPAT